MVLECFLEALNNRISLCRGLFPAKILPWQILRPLRRVYFHAMAGLNYTRRIGCFLQGLFPSPAMRSQLALEVKRHKRSVISTAS